MERGWKWRRGWRCWLAELAGQEVAEGGVGLKGGEKRWSNRESEGGNKRERDTVGGLISARR